MLEEAEAVAVKVVIRTKVFGNKASANPQADVIGEQMAGSLGELQEEVKVMEDSLQDLAWVMLQVKTRSYSTLRSYALRYAITSVKIYIIKYIFYNNLQQ